MSAMVDALLAELDDQALARLARRLAPCLDATGPGNARRCSPQMRPPRSSGAGVGGSTSSLHEALCRPAVMAADCSSTATTSTPT